MSHKSLEVVDDGELMPTPVNIRNFSVKCGHCKTYQTLVHFEIEDEWNVYTYECEDTECDREVTRTLLEIPIELDEFANRDPAWRGGKKHAGAEPEEG
jgi:hypothetical protein